MAGLAIASKFSALPILAVPVVAGFLVFWDAHTRRAANDARVDDARSDVGRADFFAVDLNRLEFTGMHDPVSAVVFGQSVNVDHTVVGGKFIVKDGQLATVDRHKLIEKHNQAAKRLLNG